MRFADRAELWYFQSWKPDEASELDVVTRDAQLVKHVKAGDMLFVPAGGVREIHVVGRSRYTRSS